MKRGYLYGIVIAIVFGTFVPNFFVIAQTVSSTSQEINAIDKEIQIRKDKIKALEKTISEYNKILTQKETESVSLKNQLSIMSNRIAQFNADIELVGEKIKETQLEIDALNISITDKKRVITKQKKIVAKMVENIHSSDQKNFLEIMLTYKTFADFYNEVKSAESVYVDLGRSVKSLRIATEDLEAKQKQVQIKQTKFTEFKNELEVSKSNLESQETAKSQLLDQTKSSEARYRTLLSSQKAQYQQIENETRIFEEKKSKQLELQDKISASGSVLMTWPVPSRIINATFHDPDYPFKRVFEHSGLDLKAPYGTAVKAVASGYIARARRCTSSSCYSYILIVHTGNLSTVYGHLSKINVTEDAFVNRGDIIGYSGGTPGTIGAGPFVTGPHLHFEVRQNGIPVDPLLFMSP